MATKEAPKKKTSAKVKDTDVSSKLRIRVRAY